MSHRTLLLATLLAAVAVGCAPRPLLERAIRARGGSLQSFVREAETKVAVGFPGTWPYRAAFLVPDRYAWIIYTSGEPDSYLYDGSTMRAFMGTRPISADAGPQAPLRSHARFTAVANLDVLRLPGVQVTPLAPPDLPKGVVAGLAAVFADDGARFRIGFDAESRVVSVEGPLVLPPLGAGTVVAAFDDFRRAGGFLLPFHVAYAFAGHPIADERASAICPDDAALTREAFVIPGRIPSCAPPH